MAAILLAIPILAGAVVLQSAILSRVTLLHGSADLVLLIVVAWALHKRVETAWHWGFLAGLLVTVISALPLGGALLSYLLATLIALLLRQRIWQAPILAMFLATFLSTLASHSISLTALRVSGSLLPWVEVLNLITLPSILLNLVLAIPVFALVSDLANELYPEPIEV
jgi:rod shape-determining protein MreD